MTDLTRDGQLDFTNLPTRSSGRAVTRDNPWFSTGLRPSGAGPKTKLASNHATPRGAISRLGAACYNKKSGSMQATNSKGGGGERALPTGKKPEK